MEKETGLENSISSKEGSDAQNEHRVSFKMKLLKGFESEYIKRHDALWPDLRDLLKSAGIIEYCIFLDEETDTLFAFMKVSDQKSVDHLASHPVMKKWWNYMKDIMETNDDHSPVSVPLKEVFYLS
jgi:L-rhamnose mutarotase